MDPGVCFDWRPSPDSCGRQQIDHAQDAVDAEPGVTEAGVGVVHCPFGLRGGARADSSAASGPPRPSSPSASYALTSSQTLVAALDHLRPRQQSIWREAPDRDSD